MTHTKAKVIKNAYTTHNRVPMRRLEECYKVPSHYKRMAMDRCLFLMEEYNGAWCSGKIIGYNSQVFSFGFIGEMNGKPAFFYITRDYDRYIYLDELEN